MDAQDPFEGAVGPLWARARGGDDAAYRAALALMAVRVRAYLRRRMAHAPGEVEDVVQETLMAVHLNRGTHEPGLPVANWVLSVARYKWVDHARRHGRRGALHDPLDDVDESALAQPEDGSAEARHDLRVLMAQLPAAQQRAIALTKIEGLSVEEAAARSGVSVSALKVQVHRGLKRLSAWVAGEQGRR
jgi:RNA polymerase sigma-70 factor (ECF subfamily)